MVDAEWDRRALIAGTVAAIAIARGVELAISARNLRRVRENGTPHAASTSSAEYAVMVVVHVLFLACPLLALRTKEQLGSNELALAALFALALAACLRWWTMWTLGPRWNARAVVAPSLGAVHGGPFRYFRHPNGWDIQSYGEFFHAWLTPEALRQLVLDTQ